MILILLAVLALGVLVFGWVLYPILLLVISRARAAPGADHKRCRTVSVILATRESPEVVRRRIEDIRRSDFPAERLQVIVSLDAGVVASLPEYLIAVRDLAEVVAKDTHKGKCAALNAGVWGAHGEILVFADSAQTFAVSAISELVAAVGRGYAVVSGRLVTLGASVEGAVLRAFWRYEVWIRRHEALVHSVIGVTGAIYAMKRTLWKPLEPGILCDDVATPMRLILSGHRVGFCDEAVAYDSRRFTSIEEYRRKVRTQAGILQLCALSPQLLNPFGNPVWVQFLCHKLIRCMSPVLLLIALPGTVLIACRLVASSSPLSIVLLCGGLLLAAAVMLIVTRGKLLWHGARVALLLSAPLAALYFAIRGKWDLWAPASNRT